MTSEVIVVIFELFIIIVFGVVGGFIVCWQAALLSIACCPFMVFGMYKMATMSWGTKGGRAKADVAD